MDRHSMDQHIDTLKQQEHALAAQLRSLHQQREQARPGTDEYKVLSGAIDRVSTDLVDTRVDLHHACQQRRPLSLDPGFVTVYRHLPEAGDYLSG